MNVSDFNVKIIGDGMPMIMLHGFQIDQTSMIQSFEPILEHSNYKRIYFDLPGMGLSKNYESIQNADDMIEEVSDLIKIIVGESHFCIAGMSYGGYLARGVLKKFFNQVEGMFLLVPVAKPLYENRILPIHEVVIEDDTYTKTLSVEVLNQLRQMKVVINEYVVNRQIAEIDEAIKRGDVHYTENYQLNGYQATYSVDDMNDNFFKPVTIIVGKQDSVVGYEDQYQLSKQFPRCTYIAIDGAGHGLHMEQVDAFNDSVKNWIKAIT